MKTKVQGLELYPPGNLLGKFANFNLYECSLPYPEDNTGILKIGITNAHNADLDREAAILKTLAEEATEHNEAFAHKFSEKRPLSYQLTYPRLEASFICEEQGNRRVNILHFPEFAQDRSEIIPLSNIVLIDRSRVDPKTSAWILGKLLKCLVFFHSAGVSHGALITSNLLIHPKNHLVTVFNWDKATIPGDKMSKEDMQADIAAVATAVFEILGGDLETGLIPESDQLPNDKYQKHLIGLINGGESSAYDAHEKFYKLIWSLWPRKYHLYTVHPLDVS